MVRQIINYWYRSMRLAAVDRESDEQLLRRFAACRDEVAFEALVRRHGPMVWGVCQRSLFHHQDAEDAFQAVFLVLAKKAGGVGRSGRLANWLYGVARRTSWNLRRRRDGQARREQVAGTLDDRRADTPEPGSGDPEIVDEELARLPDRYRLPIVLCCLEGKTHAEAGEHLSWPTGTVAGRLSRGRALLRDRLQRRGVEVTAVSLGLALAPDLVAAPLRDASVAALARWASAYAGRATAGAVPEGVRTLAEATAREISPLRSLVILSGIGGLGLGLICLAGQVSWEPASGPASSSGPPALQSESGPAARIPLPTDPSAVVLRLESVDDKRGEVRHRLTVRADGRLEALAGPPDGPAATIRGRLAGEELQDLLRFIVRGQEFFAFDAGALDRDLRREYVYDGKLDSPYDPLTTNIRVRLADREHEASWHQLASASVFFPDEKRLQQLHHVEQRLHNVLLVQVAGGAPQVQPLADWTTRRLRDTYPRLAPFTAADLSGHAPEADGTGVRMTFGRGNKTTGANYISATVSVPAHGPPSLVQVIPGLSYKLPTPVARRPFDDRPSLAGP
jgi:RNA polymerase sigma factor (sigma-70 family)